MDDIDALDIALGIILFAAGIILIFSTKYAVDYTRADNNIKNTQIVCDYSNKVQSGHVEELCGMMLDKYGLEYTTELKVIRGN